MWCFANRLGARRVVRKHRLRGVTLVELLIVITLVLMLLGIAVPLLKPAVDRGRVREGARSVSAYVALAKARAVELGRPAGIWMERSAPGSNACFELFLAEMPQPYSGDLQGATVRFSQSPDRPWIADQRVPGSRFEFSETMHGMLNPEGTTVSSQALIKPGETFYMRFNFKGPLYQVTRGPNTVLGLDHPAQFALPPGIAPPQGASATDNQPGVPFEIFRAPVRTSGRSLQLTAGTIVDLENSGIGVEGRQFQALSTTDDLPVVIMFFPGGGVERIVMGGVYVPPTSSIYLLIGTTAGQELADNTPETPNPIAASSAVATPVLYNKNLANSESVWVSIGHRSGTVSTSQNGWLLLPPPPWPPGTRPFFQNSLRAAREFAQSSEMLGGR
jgi:type II secretory pathway pseudopilin PulG